MDALELHQVTELFRRLAGAANVDLTTARQLRNALVESGLLDVYGAGSSLDVLELLDAGGEAVLRMRLQSLQVAELRAIIAAHQYDPEKQSARWRSAARLIDLIVARALEQLEAEDADPANHPTAAASWML
ncbi:MAG TPA: hypothetical protein VGP82_09735 [Ktedonobacterales bacterium]|nr:hypothetical protein [Ktedonobacterales bacterium]